MSRTVPNLAFASALVVMGLAAGCKTDTQTEDELKVQRQELANQAQVIAKLQGELRETQRQKQLLETAENSQLRAKLQGTWEIYTRTNPGTDSFLTYIVNFEADGAGKVVKAYAVRPAAEKEQTLDAYAAAAIANPIPGTQTALKERPAPVPTSVEWKITDGKVALEFKNVPKGRYTAGLVVVGDTVFLSGLAEDGGGFLARRAVLKESAPNPPKGPPGK